MNFSWNKGSLIDIKFDSSPLVLFPRTDHVLKTQTILKLSSWYFFFYGSPNLQDLESKVSNRQQSCHTKFFWISMMDQVNFYTEIEMAMKREYYHGGESCIQRPSLNRDFHFRYFLIKIFSLAFVLLLMLRNEFTVIIIIIFTFLNTKYQLI